MKDRAPVVIGTSIAPKELERQQAVVASWISLGFEVLSLNVEEEISALRPHFPDVRFATANRTAAERAGRPLVYFDDLLAALAETGRPVVGIVNSDVELRGDDCLMRGIAAEAAGSFLFGSRIDVETPDAASGTPYEGGFDYFFLDRDLISLYPATDYAIGLPWWDYWAPAVPALNGVPLKRLTAPIAWHLRHDLNWQSPTWLYYASIFARYVTLGFEQAAARQSARKQDDPVYRWTHFVATLWAQLYRDRVAQYQFAQSIAERGSPQDKERFKQDIGGTEYLLVKHYGNLAETTCAYLKAVSKEVALTPAAVSYAGST